MMHIILLICNACDSNHIVSSFRRLFWDLEALPVSSTRKLFKGVGQFSLSKAILNGRETCMDGLKAHQVTSHIYCAISTRFVSSSG